MSRLKIVQAGKYKWQLLYKLDDMAAAFLAHGKRVRDVEVTQFGSATTAHGHVLFSGDWGKEVKHFGGAIQFEDGTIVCCVEVSEWNGDEEHPGSLYHNEYYKLY